MTKAEFSKLPATRKGLSILEKEFAASGNMFYNEVARLLRTHIQLPAAVKKVKRFNFEEIHQTFVKVKNTGMRKELILPF